MRGDLSASADKSIRGLAGKNRERTPADANKGVRKIASADA